MNMKKIAFFCILLLSVAAPGHSGENGWTPLQLNIWRYNLPKANTITGLHLYLNPEWESPVSSYTVYGVDMGLIYQRASTIGGAQIGFCPQAELFVGAQVGIWPRSSEMYGMQSGYFTQSGSLYGVQAGGINIAGMEGPIYGLQLGGANFAGRNNAWDFSGAVVQLGVFENYAGLNNLTGIRNIYVVQVALLNQASHAVSQFGFGNSADNAMLQIGIFNGADNKQWIQIGGHNRSEGHGVVQVGLYNVAGDVHGIQLGIYNSASRLYGVQVGLVNNVKEAANLRILPLVNIRFMKL